MVKLANLVSKVETVTPPSTHRWPYLYGVELELEEVSVNGQMILDYDWDDDDRPDIPEGWSVHEDGSLRRGSEFVLEPPCREASLESALENFYSVNYSYTAGPRTSTHIHVNMTDATDDELRTLVVLVYTMECGIYALSEESRKWGGYSVPLTEMATSRLRNILNPASVQVLRESIIARRNQERYYGFNVSLQRHGTVEFRYFPGGPSREVLESWLDLVTQFKTASKNYTLQGLSERINTHQDLADFILEAFPGNWGQKFLSAYPVETYFNHFEDVMALATDTFNPERVDSLVYLNPALIRYLHRTELNGNEEAISYLTNSLSGIGEVVTTELLQYYLINASAQSYNSDRVQEVVNAPLAPGTRRSATLNVSQLADEYYAFNPFQLSPSFDTDEEQY